MTDSDVKKLKKLIDDGIKPIKEVVEVVNHKVGLINSSQSIMSAQLGMVKDQMSVINDKLDIHTASLVTIENTLEGYADMYKVNKDKIEELNGRVDAVEVHLNIAPRK